ncbi:MAG: hypothetical protein SOT70_03955 [Lachnospiraceae bacterium]|nr:hypothetical protein [Lachnospiraceae bacterium]
MKAEDGYVTLKKSNGGERMAMVGIYSNGVIKTKTKLCENQKVIITPVKRSAFGRFKSYADTNLIPLEKEELEREIIEVYQSKQSGT